MSATPDDGATMADELDDALLTGYLLGTCTDEEMVRVEDQVFAATGAFERLRDVEEQLIDRRRRGELTSEQREQFDRAYAAPARRRRVEFATSLNAVLAEETASGGAAESRPSRWALVGAAFDFRLALAAAAVLLLAAVAVWRLDVARVQSSLARAEADNAALRQQQEADRQRVADLERRAAALDEELARERAARGSTSAPGPAAPVIATFVLSPGLLRSGGEPARVVISPAADGVRLQLDLEPGIDHASFRVELRNSAARVIWSGMAGRVVLGDAAAVVVTVPAERFETGEHEVVLFGALDGGRYEDAGHYYFTVTRPQP